MSDSNLAVKITADVADLQVKFAIAQATTRGLTSEMNKLAAVSAKGIIDPAGSAKLQQVAGDLLHARGEAGALAGAMERAGVSVGGFGTRLAGSEVHVATLARETRRLFTELQAGSTGGADVTILRLAQHLLGLGPAGLVAVGAVGALTAGLGFLIARAIETSNALDKIAIGAQFAGNMDLSREKIKQFADQMSASADISSKDALKISDAIARIPGMTTPGMQALANQMGALAGESGKTADQIAGEVTRMFAAGESATKVAQSLGGVTQAQINAATAADKSGDANQVAAAKLSILQSTLERARSSLDQHNASMTASWKNTLAYSLAVGDAISVEDVQANLLDSENTKRAQNNQLIQQGIALLKSTPQAPEQTLKAGVQVAEGENPVSKQVDEAKAKIAQMTAALAAARQASDQVSVDKLVAGLAKARENLSALQSGPALEQMRTQMSQVAATWDGTQTGMLQKQREIAAQELASVSSNSKERLAVLQEIARLDVEIRKSAAGELIASVRTQNAAINADTKLSGAQRLEAEQESWLALLANDRIVGQQRQEVERELTNTVTALARERASQAQAIARENVATDIAISKMQVEAQKSVLDTELAAHQVSASQKLSILKGLTQEEYALDLQQLNNELSTLNELTPEHAKVFNQIRELKAKLVVDLAALDRQGAADAKRAADEEAKSWQKAVGEIESAESTMLGDLLAKRKSFSQAALQAVGQLVDQEIIADVRAMTTRLLIQDQSLAAQKALGQGGLLYHAAVEQEGTTHTAAAQAAQTAAVTAGGQARVAAEASAGLESKGVANAINLPTIQSDAAKAAAGAYSAVAGVPFVGPILAPIAAGVAYTAVAAYGSLASLDVGAWNVPQDMTANIHAGEMVVPRDYASGMRAQAGGQGDAGGGDTYGDFHQTNHLHQVMSSPEVLLAHLKKAARNFHPATRALR
jgi:hypothetical protein